jgi:DNA-binding NarL/FixJ family response regulator
MRYVLVDDHFLIREALCGVLKELDPDATVLEASTWRDAGRLLEEHPDIALVLLDLVLPDQDGFAALKEIRTRCPRTPVVILSAQCDRDRVTKAIELGAAGFIPKSGERRVMLSALRLVFSGGVYIPPEALAGSKPAAPAPSLAVPPLPSPRAGAKSPADFGLTARQMDVLALMMRGISNKAICRTLSLAEPTVRNHVTAILKSLNVSNRTEAVVMVGALGWELPRLGEDSLIELAGPSDVRIRKSGR